MPEKCPRCGSFDTEVLPDGSSMCKRCGHAFIVPGPEDAVIPEKKPTPDHGMSPDELRTRSMFEASTTPDWRREYAGAPYITTQYTGPKEWDRRTRAKRDRLRVGGMMTFVGAPFFLISIPVVITVMLALVSSLVGRTVSLGEFLDALGQTGLAIIFYLGILLQIVFFFVALILGFSMRNCSQGAAIGAVGFGIVAIVISFLLLGGIVAAIGGILALVGGVIGAAGSF